LLIFDSNEIEQNWTDLFAFLLLCHSVREYKQLHNTVNSLYFLYNIVCICKSSSTFLFKICSKWVIGEIDIENGGIFEHKMPHGFISYTTYCE
jgi:hypothetical protein